jgi:two-component system response regulator FixJ
LEHSPLVFVVDDDADVRDSLRVLLETAGYAIEDFASARNFLNELGSRNGACLITDIRMPEMTGLQLQEEIERLGIDLPVVIITGHADVPLSVRAMKAGAVDFIEKPFDDSLFIGSVRRAIEIGDRRRNQRAEVSAARQLVALLTPRERHVLDQLVAGRSNKLAAHALGISPRTVEIHRARIMDKMNAKSLSDVVRVALAAASVTAGETSH